MRLCLLREEGETVFPECGQVGSQLRQSFRAGVVEPPCPHATLHDEAGLPQHAEVLGDSGAGECEVGGDGARGELRIADEAEDFLAVGFGDCVQRLFHGRMVSDSRDYAHVSTGRRIMECILAVLSGLALRSLGGIRW